MIDLQADPSTWEAGRETDVAVAEAMGWTNIRPYGSGDPPTRLGGTPPNVGHDGWLWLPPFTTDRNWNGMRLMVEYAKTEGLVVHLNIGTFTNCELVKFEPPKEYWVGVAPTVPLAIARALLVYNGK